MQIIEKQDFTVRPYRLNNTEEKKDLPDFLRIEEVKVLKRILGVLLYNELAAAIDAGGSIAQKWLNLKDGSTYDYCGHTYEYTGLRDFLVPYLWAMWTRETVHLNTSSGIVVPQPGDNTRVISPARKIVSAYNDFYDKVGNCEYQKNTLYGFLNENKSIYNNWVWIDPGNMNQFNL